MSKVIKIGDRYYRPTTRSYAVAASAADPLADLRQSLVDALGSEAADELLGKVTVKPKRLSTGLNTRAVRAAGTFLCPDFGVEFWANGVHHLDRCGIDDNGGFGSQKRLDAHLKWAQAQPRTYGPR